MAVNALRSKSQEPLRNFLQASAALLHALACPLFDAIAAELSGWPRCARLTCMGASLSHDLLLASPHRVRSALGALSHSGHSASEPFLAFLK
jgi:hypothetical protein